MSTRKQNKRGGTVAFALGPTTLAGPAPVFLVAVEALQFPHSRGYRSTNVLTFSG